MTTKIAVLRPDLLKVQASGQQIRVDPSGPVVQPILHLPLNGPVDVAPPPATRGLPVVTDDEASAFPDQNLPDAWWYVPDVQLELPEATATPPTSPFLFSYQTDGHDAQGRVGIDATVTVTVRRFKAPATTAVIGRNVATATPVLLANLTFGLEVPYRDANGVDAVWTAPSAAISATDDGYTVQFTAKDAFARATYGALSRAGYQDRPVRLTVDFTFDAVRPVTKKSGWPWLLVPPPHQDPARMNVQSPTARPQGSPPPEPIRTFASPPRLFDPTLLQEAQPAQQDGIPLTLTTQTLAPQSLQLFRLPDRTSGVETTFVAASIARHTELDLLVPCADFGALYVEQTGQGTSPVGCVDSLALGQVPDHLYQLLPTPATTRYAVYSALATPGTFLVLPLHYRVGRDASVLDASGALRPLIGWLQEFDATHDDQLPCLLSATLQPDLDSADLADIADVLRAHSSTPNLVLPTSVASGVVSRLYHWNPTGAPDPAVSIDGDVLRVTVSCDYAQAAVLQALLTAGANAIIGDLTFGLSDGTSLGPVALHLSVDTLVGPWPTGPVRTNVAGQVATLSNLSGADATVTRVRCFAADGTELADGDPAVETMQTGTSVDVATPDKTSSVILSVALAALTQVAIAAQRVYLDDMHTIAVILNDVQMQSTGISSIDVAVSQGASTPITVTLTPLLPQVELDIVSPLVPDPDHDDAVLILTCTTHSTVGTATTLTPQSADLHNGAVILLSSLLTPQ